MKQLLALIAVMPGAKQSWSIFHPPKRTAPSGPVTLNPFHLRGAAWDKRYAKDTAVSPSGEAGNSPFIFPVGIHRHFDRPFVFDFDDLPNIIHLEGYVCFVFFPICGDNGSLSI